MMRLSLTLIASLALLPALGGCDAEPVAAHVPLSKVALEAVSADPGTDREKLARAVDALFAEDAPGETRALLVLHGGEVAAERYGEGFGPDTRFLGWSMAKTVTALAIGMLVSEGRLELDASAPVAHWQRSGDPRGEITLRQLLQMRSGLRHEETADPPYTADTIRLLFLDGRDDMAAQAEAEPLEAEPGRTFEYSTATSIILADIAARVLSKGRDPAQRRAAVDNFLGDRLFGPIGLDSMTAEYDAAGTLIGGAMIWATARDWGKLGEFLRHGGSVRGAQLVSRRWIEFMKTPSPRAGDYGAHLWLNRDSGGERVVLFPAQGPADAFAAAGHMGQYIIVSPRQKLTVVRLGRAAEEDTRPLVEKLAAIFALYPGG